jgi:hypothetical protein
MSDERTVKKIFLGETGRKKKRRETKIMWLECIANDLKWMGVKRWGEHSRRQNCIGCHSGSGTG